MALIIAIVGAESTGKSSLVQALVPRLAAAGHGRVAGVGEYLREWCDREQRTPRQDEQAGVMHEQHRRIQAAAACHDLVLCDTTALMTHVYSESIFGDPQLRGPALALHAQARHTLLTALDLPWVADGQRDGPHVRAPIDAALRGLLLQAGLPFSVVGGQGETRVQQALAALAPVLAAAQAKSPGLFTRLTAAATDAERAAGWACACCAVPEFERALMRR